MYKYIALVSLLVSFSLPAAETPSTKITWHGHAAFEIVTPGGADIMIDPWLKNPQNPLTKNEHDPLPGVKKLDYILITHGHPDHVGDSVALAKATRAKLVANFDLATNMARVLGYPADQMSFDTLGNIGGEVRIANGEVTVLFVPAIHSSSLDPSNERNKTAPLVYAGNANGFIIRIKDGPTIYHSGDTAYFKDMEQLASQQIDLALLNIGGHFGMEPEQAVLAAQAVKAKLVIPQHYGTFPVLTQDPEPFMQMLDKKKINFYNLKPGFSLEFEGKKLKEPSA